MWSSGGLARGAGGAAVLFALAQGALATAAAYVAVMLIRYERLGSAWASAAVLLAEMLPGMLAGPLIGAWLDRRDRLRWAIAADAVRGAALAALIVLPGVVSLLAVAVVTGVAGALFRPAAFALLPAVVHERGGWAPRPSGARSATPGR